MYPFFLSFAFCIYFFSFEKETKKQKKQTKKDLIHKNLVVLKIFLFFLSG